MKIAIHSKFSGFHPEWVNYLIERKINYDLIDFTTPDSIKRLLEYDVILWHYSHLSLSDMIIAKELILALAFNRKITFPEYNPNLIFEDKILQYYLLESNSIITPFMSLGVIDSPRTLNTLVFFIF